MSRSVERISRRAALQNACTGALGAAAALAALPRGLSAASLGAHAACTPVARGAERLLMIFWRDPSLTGADELAYFHGSSTRLEPSLGSWLVHAKGAVNPQVAALQCVEWGPTTSAQRMAFAGALPKACRGEVKTLLQLPSEPGHEARTVGQLTKEFDRGARVVQAMHSANQSFSMARFSRAQQAQPSRCLLVLAGTRARLEASRKQLPFPSRQGVLLQIADTSLHVLLHSSAMDSRFRPEATVATAAGHTSVQQVRAIDMHATVLAGMGQNAARLVHLQEGRRTIRPIAAQGRLIPGVYA
jgi:hypothetical protein